MKRRFLVAFTLLIVASLLAALGTGAIDVFSATRTAEMQVVTDADGLISLIGDGKYGKTDGKGKLALDFTNTSAGGKGFNPQAKSEFHNVFTITNKSEKTVYVWLEAEGWSSHHNAGLKYVVNETNGNVIKGIDTYKTETLLDSTGWNFKDGVGSLAYVELEPGEYFNVNIYVKTTLSNGYGDPGYDWSHKVIVKANTNPPSRPAAK
ncbi:MAG: hypothetical protein GX024_09205 [Clostridiales bacterium]|nr:hypothetical protein [Clostridiales bacterium]